VSAPSYALIRGCLAVGLLDSDTIGLPNLLLGEQAVTELKQTSATAAAIARETWALLTDVDRRARMQQALAAAAGRLARRGSVERAAGHVLAAVQAREPGPPDARVLTSGIHQ
jgi:lipid A disaccharide synthetase